MQLSIKNLIILYAFKKYGKKIKIISVRSEISLNEVSLFFFNQVCTNKIFILIKKCASITVK